MKLSTADQVQAFVNACNEQGFSWEIASQSVLRIKKTIPVGDHNAFAACDIMCGSVLAYAPLKGGSIWGTDGGSIGGMVALKSGKFVMNKSGQGSRFMTALEKIKQQ